MPARHELGSFRMREKLLETGRKRLVVEHLILPAPDQQGWEFRLLQLALEHSKRNWPRALSSKGPSPCEETRSRIRQDALINGLGFRPEPLAVDHGQVHSAPGKSVVTSKK